jgi:hypothetical protein
LLDRAVGGVDGTKAGVDGDVRKVDKKKIIRMNFTL